MASELLYLFWNLILISLVTVGGGGQPLLEHMAITQKGWITTADFSAALTFGSATPGPTVLISATFIGYAVGGLWGALIGTVGIFLMPWLLAVTATKVIDRFFHLPRVQGFIYGVQAAIVGLVVTTAHTIGKQLDHRVIFAVIIFGSLLAARYTKTHRFLILLAGFIINLLALWIERSLS